MKILFCTVGGSYQPVLTCIKEQQPDYTYFICSQDDDVSGYKGSYTQINAKGNIIEKEAGEKSASLPNIPTQLGMNETAYEIVTVPSDRLNEIVEEISKIISEAQNKYPESSFIADFTGGTKSMTAGLVVAALDFNTVKLQIITAQRTNLNKVDTRSSTQPLDMEDVLFNRSLNQHLMLLKHFSYAEALKGINELACPHSRTSQKLYHSAKLFCEGFAYWDKFDHQQAYESLKSLIKTHQELQVYINNLSSIISDPVNEKKQQKQELLKIFDLWNNALRKQQQQRYDDAVARMYRMIEWSAQWILSSQHQINSGDVKEEQLPDEMKAAFKFDREVKLGLMQCWELISMIDKTAAGPFARKQLKTILNLIKPRNSSILAHGFAPIAEADVNNINSWIENDLLNLLLHLGEKYGVKQLPQQLPTDFF
jgi:CRISPR-associated protein (TIGR02710 family)